MERTYDPATQRRLVVLGLSPGWTCLEAGAGSGSISRQLAGAVGPEGRIVAADLDTTLLVDQPEGVEVTQLDLRTEALPEATFDLVHARLLLNHLPERETVLDKLVAALRPGGRLLLEEGDAVGPGQPLGGEVHRTARYFGHVRHWEPADLQRRLRDLQPEEQLESLADQLVRAGRLNWAKYRLVQVSLVLAPVCVLAVSAAVFLP